MTAALGTIGAWTSALLAAVFLAAAALATTTGEIEQRETRTRPVPT